MSRTAERLAVFAIGSLTILSAMAARPADRDPDELGARVIILANRDEPESMRLAHYYAERRDVPVANIAALPMSSAETVDWHQFVAEVFDPLQQWMLDRGWIDAIPMEMRDHVGRRKLAIQSHHVSFLVVCRGVPLKIRETPDIGRDSPAWLPPPLRTQSAAVDSELALLAQSGPQIDGPLPNPLFGREAPSPADRARVILVSRLDGPTIEAAQQLVDGALAVEEQGLAGRAYIDSGGPHPMGDRWLAVVTDELAELGFDPTVERRSGAMAPTERADAAVFYFGWYDEQISGPFSLPGYRFAPGAIAFHIHSFSATTLRSEDGGWCGPLVARGAAATFGNVHEPYLEYTHQPHLLLRALVRGARLGEAAFHALPGLSWQAIAIGDPLYRPFRVSEARQWSRRADLPPALAPYRILRRVRLLDRQGRSDEAVALVREAEQAMPSLVLTLEIARRQGSDVLDPALRDRLASVIGGLERVQPSEWGLLAEAARRLSEAGAKEPALRAWQALLGQTLPPIVKRQWLQEAQRAAVDAGDPALGRQWGAELGALERSAGS